MRKSIKSIAQKQEGFTLLEVMLSVFVFGFIAVGLVQITQNFLQDQQVNATAQHIKIVHNKAYDYVMDNFLDIYNVRLGGVGGVGNLFEIPVEDSGGLAHFLKNGARYLPDNFNAVNPMGQTVTTLVRNVADRTVEIITITTGDLVEDSLIQQAASVVGGAGGLWSAIDRDPGVSDTSTTVTGVYGMWSVAVPDLATWSGVSFPPTIAGGSYLATYQFINYVDEQGDYLYRRAVPLMAEANTMNTDLDLNNFSIDGVDDVQIAGQLNVTNAANLAGAVTIGGLVDIGGNLNITKNLIPTLNTLAIIPDGAQIATTLDINNSLRAQDLRMATGTLSSNITDISGNFSNLGFLSAQRSDATGVAVVSTPALVTTLETEDMRANNGQLTTQTATVGTVTTSTGLADAQEIVGSGSFQTGDLITEGLLIIDNLDVTNRFECDTSGAPGC